MIVGCALRMKRWISGADYFAIVGESSLQMHTDGLTPADIKVHTKMLFIILLKTSSLTSDIFFQIA